MPPQRDPSARGVQVGFRGHRVLLVAELVGDVGEKLDEGDLQIGHVPFDPVGHGQRHPVQQQPGEAVVVLGRVVDNRERRRNRRAGSAVGAVVIGGAGGAESEGCARVTRVEARVGPIARPAVRVSLDHAERVGRAVSGPVDGDDHRVVELRVVGTLNLDSAHGDAGNPPAAVDTDVGGPQATGPRPCGRLAEKRDGEGTAVVAGLDRVDPGQPPGTDRSAP